MIHNRKARVATRRVEAVERARQVLQQVVDGSLDAYEGYRSIYGIYLDTSGLAEELKQFFRLPGVEPDGFLHVDDEFRIMIRRLAGEWLHRNKAR
jgi:hypothetical protein